MNKKINKIYKVLIIAMLFISCFNSNMVFATDKLTVNAKASMIVELNSGKVIYEDNTEVQNYPASLTKILTAILVLENCELNDTVTVSQSAISNIPQDYVVTPLYVGEKISVKDLLYALLLKSANDAAYVLAEHVGGTVEKFSNMMNKKAEEIGCKNSHFLNPNGIHDDNHYTTAYDMFLITKYAIENEKFEKIVSTYRYTISTTNKCTTERVMENSNFFVCPPSKYYDKDVKGIKTGTTQQAGNCLITNIEKNGFNVITLVLGAKTKESRFTETKKMIDYMFDNYTHTQIHKQGDIIKTIEIENATKETKNLNLVISDDVTVMNNIDTKLDEIKPEIILKENIKAPLKQGQELGTVKYNVEGLEYTVKLLAEHDVDKKTNFVQIAIGIGTVFMLLCIITIKKKKMKKKRFKTKKYMRR